MNDGSENQIFLLFLSEQHEVQGLRELKDVREPVPLGINIEGKYL
jgi:hypothetical protein